jgi:hypothetical protein
MCRGSGRAYPCCPQKCKAPARQGDCPTRVHPVLVFGKFRLAFDHVGWRGPGRPGFLPGDPRSPAPSEAVTPDADAITHCLAIPHRQVQETLMGFHNDGAWLRGGVVVDDLPVKFRIDLGNVDGWNRKTLLRSGRIHLHIICRDRLLRLGLGGSLAVVLPEQPVAIAAAAEIKNVRLSSMPDPVPPLRESS